MRLAGQVVGLTLVICVLGACSSGAGRSGGSSTTSRSSVSSEVTSTTSEKVASAARWTTYDGDVARTGVAPDGPSSASGVREQWRSSTLDGDVYAQPLVVGGRVVVATENDTVYSLRASRWCDRVEATCG